MKGPSIANVLIENYFVCEAGQKNLNDLSTVIMQGSRKNYPDIP